MDITQSLESFRAAATGDKELAYKLRGLDATVRIGPDASPFDLKVVGGAVQAAEPASGDADVVMSAPDAFWQASFARPLADPGYETLTMSFARGLKVEGDLNSLVAAYQGAWQRLYLVLRKAVSGLAERRAEPAPRRETDNAIGRYAYVKANGQEARIYFETAGTGPTPLLLQPTAGADGA